ncbi:phosphoglucosamine mutase [bacterium]|nr:MAG: phosphoglucosamine mutase [bacterium]
MFGTDGIRGIPYKSPLTSYEIKKIGFSISQIIKNKELNIESVFIARDTRKSCDFIIKNLKIGLNKGNIGIIDLGVLPTAAISIFIEKYKYHFGIMVTASHNAHKYNGIKIFNHHGEKISDKDQKKIETFYKSLGIEKYNSNNKMNVTYKNAQYEYINLILEKFKNNINSKLKIGIDLANGASHKITKLILDKVNVDASIISNSPNGKNINLKSGVENTLKLKQLVKRKKLDLGVAIDGDADRVVFLDFRGDIIKGDQIIQFFAKKILKRNLPLVTTIMTNNKIKDNLKSKKIRIIQTDVGDRNVYFEMLKNGSNFGGENSGHYIFKDFLKTSDANFTILKLLSLVKSRIDINKISNIKLNPSCLKSFEIKRKKPIEKIEFIRKYKKKFHNKYKDYYLNIRYSGTESKIRILIQGPSMKIIKNEIKLFGMLLVQNKL